MDGRWRRDLVGIRRPNYPSTSTLSVIGAIPITVSRHMSLDRSGVHPERLVNSDEPLIYL